MNTTSANMGAMITPPPPPGLVVVPPTSDKETVEQTTEQLLLASHRNNVGGDTRVSAMKVDGGRLFFYEYVEQINRSGVVSRVVAASAIAFGAKDTGKEKTVEIRLVSTLQSGPSDETRISEVRLKQGRLFIYEQVAQVHENGLTRKSVRNASMLYVSDDTDDVSAQESDSENDSKPKRGRPPKNSGD